MKKLNLNFGAALFFIMLFFFTVSFYLFRFLAFSAQGGSGFSVKLFFNLLLFAVEFTGVFGLLSPIVGAINDKSTKFNISWKAFIVFSFFLTVITLILTKGSIGI